MPVGCQAEARKGRRREQDCLFESARGRGGRRRVVRGHWGYLVSVVRCRPGSASGQVVRSTSGAKRYQPLSRQWGRPAWGRGSVVRVASALSCKARAEQYHVFYPTIQQARADLLLASLARLSDSPAGSEVQTGTECLTDPAGGTHENENPTSDCEPRQ